MRIVFLGTSDFAVPSLNALLDESGLEVTAVITQQDQPRGRGHRLLPTPVKARAAGRGLPVYQPQRIRSDESRLLFERLAPDLLVVAAYGQILPPWLLALPPRGAVNVHASILPHYRGAAPIQWALLNGERRTGVTLMQMDEGLDSGPILLQEWLEVGEEETAGELHDRLARLGAGLLIRTLDQLRAASLRPQPQDASRATLAPRITREMGRLQWSDSAAALHNRIRAMNPWPGAFCLLRDQELKIWRSRCLRQDSPPAERSSGPGRISLGPRAELLVACGDGGIVELVEVSLPGRKRISGTELVHGQRLRLGEVLQPARADFHGS